MKQAGNEAVITAEYRLLNALIYDKNFRNDSRIHVDLFIHETARSIYEAIDRLDKADVPITEASLFQAANEIDFAVTRPIIATIFSIEKEGVHTLDDILATLENAKQKKLIIEKAEEIVRASSTNGPLNQETILQHVAEIDAILKNNTQRSLLKSFDQWSDEYIAELEERSKGKRYPYGDEKLDQYILKGAYPGAITTIAAGTGQGKSTYILNIINSLINLYIPSMYVSLEMSGIDTYDRLISLRKEIPMSALYANDESLYSIIELVKEEKQLLKDNNRFYFVEEPLLSIAKLRALIKEFKQRSKSDYAVVAIDLITQLTDFIRSRGNNSMANTMEIAMNALNALAKDQNVHIIAAVQLNREVDNHRILTIEDLDLLRPTLNHIKNSAAIAERSRVVLSLFRKKYYSDRYLIGVEGAETIPDILEVNILKNSSGTVGHNFKYAFEGEYFKVTPLLEDEAEALQASAELDIEY